jgi:2-octaprenyl-6-methoxyphenol hydroxylase
MTAMPLPIVISGGGPTGLACALLLAQRGLASVLVESRAPEAARRDRRLLALARGSWDLLEPALAPALPPRAPITEVHISSAGEFGVTRLSAADHGGTPLGATVHYGDLLDALAGAAHAQRLIELRQGRQVATVAQKPERVDVTLDDGTVLAAALIVHAEGAAPAPAHAAAPPWALIAEVCLQGPATGTAFERFTREGPLALLPAPAARGPVWSLVWCADEAGVQRRRALPDNALRAELQQAIGVRLARVTAVGDQRAAYPLPARRRERLVEHRAVWLGNAAQTLHPVAGQGFNLALRDCAVLAAVLGAADEPSHALAQYARRRRADRAAIDAVTRLLPPLFASRAAPLAVARMAALAALDLLPPLRREWAQLLMFGVR